MPPKKSRRERLTELLEKTEDADMERVTGGDGFAGTDLREALRYADARAAPQPASSGSIRLAHMTDASDGNASDGDDDAAALKPQADGGASSDDEDARASKKAQKKQRKKDKKEKKKKAGRREGAITAAAFFDVTPNDAAAPPAAAPAAREAPSAREAMEDKVQLLVARGYDDAAIVALLERDGYRATVDAAPAPAPAKKPSRKKRS